jgi:stage V sporulation protein R
MKPRPLALEQPLPLAERPGAPLPGPSDWSFELVERYHRIIADTAARFGLDTYPNQLEIITAEQMMDAYSSVGMPVNYRHWSSSPPRRTTSAATWGWRTRSSSTATLASAT